MNLIEHEHFVKRNFAVVGSSNARAFSGFIDERHITALPGGILTGWRNNVSRQIKSQIRSKDNLILIIGKKFRIK